MLDCFFKTLTYCRLRFFSIGYKKRIAIQIFLLLLVAVLGLMIKPFLFANLAELDLFRSNSTLALGAGKWDKWTLQMQKKGYRSIGDVFNQCEDESSRVKIGKVLIHFDKRKGSVIATVASNFTMPVSVDKGTVHVIAQFLGRTLFDKKYQMCKVKVDTFKCPLKKGQKMHILETFSLPKYIPKGQYKSYASVYNQDNVCFITAVSELKV